MKKIFSLLAACTLFAVCLPVSAADAVTEDSALLQNSVVEQTDPYTFYFVPERTYVSAEEVQAGDVRIPTKVYIKGNTQPIKQITGARIRYQSDSSSLYFSNSSNILSTTDMDYLIKIDNPHRGSYRILPLSAEHFLYKYNFRISSSAPT